MNTRMSSHFFLLLALLTVLMTAGCKPTLETTQAPASPPKVEASSTPLPPTPTTPPTATPTAPPTDTPTPVPSPTPDAQKTAEAIKSATADAINALVSPDLEKYQVDPSSGHVVWMEPDTIELYINSYLENKNYSLKEAGKMTDFVAQTEVTWSTSGGLALCGVTFRADDDLDKGKQNRFFMMRLQYAPAWTIWFWDKGNFQYFVSPKWVSSGNINDTDGSKNLIALVVQGKKIDIYINYAKQRQLEETKLKEGKLALSAYQESGETRCEFNHTWVWAFDK
jgi:hypothetical protein